MVFGWPVADSIRISTIGGAAGMLSVGQRPFPGTPSPFGLNLSKPCLFLPNGYFEEKVKVFDKLRVKGG